MLGSAFEGDSNSVGLDLLTSEDLEALRQASGLSAGRAAHSTNSGTSKRYLILTYQGEFDKVHYPMALSFCDVEDASELKRTIVQLRDELDILRAAHPSPSRTCPDHEASIANLKADKDRLSRQLDQYGSENSRLRELVESVKTDNQFLRSRVDALDAQLKSSSSARSRISTLSSPSRPLPRVVKASSSSLLSPASSMRASSPVRRGDPPSRSSSPYSNTVKRPPTVPSIRRQSPIRLERSPVIGTSQRLSATRSPSDSTRSIDYSSPRRASRTAPTRNSVQGKQEAPVASLSEVDARLQALQNFLKHQKNSRLPNHAFLA